MSNAKLLLSDCKEAWPSMADEAREMLEAAVLMYAFADLRSLIRKKRLSENQLMTLPVTAQDVMSAFKNNLATLQDYIADTDFYLSSLYSIQASLARQSVDPETGEAVFCSGRLVEFDDENSWQELVYGIAVNSARRRITVGFRGSVTIKDFMVDANLLLAEIENPVEGLDSAIHVHSGFREYLFGQGRKSNHFVNTYEQILQRLQQLFEQYPGYRLYVTGHSLGGSIATLFSFFAAADDRIEATVTCVSIASPKVGTLNFRRAFYQLEQRKQLRCLRIANHKDLVTLVPDRHTFSCLYVMCCQSHVYRHVGVGLKLLGGKKYSISKPHEKYNWYLTLLFQDWMKHCRHWIILLLSIPMICCCKENYLRYHGCREYMDRLLDVSDELETVYLDSCYKPKK